MPNLVLASTSRYRRELLERLGVPFAVEAPRIDEDLLKQPGLEPRAFAEHLAEAKAASVAAIRAGDVVIGSDQVVEVEGHLLGKPGDHRGASEQLARLAGRDHRLITAVVVIAGTTIRRHTDVTTLAMRRLDAAAIERYLTADRPYDCAGSYKIEARGIALFERIESADHAAITGLPLIALAAILRGFGFQIP